MKLQFIASLPNVLALLCHVMSLIMETHINFQNTITILVFLRSQCSGIMWTKVQIFKVVVHFLVWTWYILLQSLYICLDTKQKHKKKTIWKRIGSKKIWINGNGDFFLNLIKTVANLFGFFLQSLEILSFMSKFLTKEELKIL